MDWIIKNKYWLALLIMSAVNAHFTQYINRFKEGTYTYNLALGTVTMMIVFMLLGLVIFGLGKIFFRDLNFQSYIKICTVVGFVLTILFLISYANI